MSDRVPIDFGDLLVAIASDLDDIRQCIGCGADSTWAGFFVGDDAVISVTAWCDAPTCEHDRTTLSAGRCLALPIDHLPVLRRRNLDTQEKPMTARFQIVRTHAGWHQRLLGSNGEPISHTEVHPDSRDAASSIAVTAETFGITMTRPPEEHDGCVWGYDGYGHLAGARVEYVDERGTRPEAEDATR